MLGKARASSTRKDVDQEVVSVGKAEAPLRYDPAKKEWFFKGSVMGTYYDNTPQQLAFTMYKHGETATPDYADIDKQMEATATHELAHGIFKSAYPAWGSTSSCGCASSTGRAWRSASGSRTSPTTSATKGSQASTAWIRRRCVRTSSSPATGR